MKSKCLTLLFLLFGLLLLNNTASAALVNLANAGFENPYLNDNEGTSFIPGWNVTNIDPNDIGFGSYIENPTFSSFFTSEIEGRNILTANKGEIVSQITNINISGNTQYTLQVNIGNRAFSPDIWNGYLIQLWAGDSLLAEDNSTLLPLERSFITTSITYTAPSNDALTGSNIEIRLQSFSTIDVAFDNVTFDVAPVPLPASIWLFLSGLLGLMHLNIKSKIKPGS